MIEDDQFNHLTANPCKQLLKGLEDPWSAWFTRWARLAWTRSTALMWASRSGQDLMVGFFGHLCIVSWH